MFGAVAESNDGGQGTAIALTLVCFPMTTAVRRLPHDATNPNRSRVKPTYPKSQLQRCAVEADKKGHLAMRLTLTIACRSPTFEAMGMEFPETARTG